MPPALTIKSGQTIMIDTVSHQGLLGKEDPVAFFASAGIPKDQVLQDAIDIYKTVPRTKGMSVHGLTGPIYVEGAVRATCWKCASIASTCACRMA